MFLNRLRNFFILSRQIILRMESMIPEKSIKEGQAELYVTTKKVFYNPVQEFNRDLSIAVLTIFANEFKAEKREQLEAKAKKRNPTENVDMDIPEIKIDVLEALSATGLRSIRYAKEVPNLTKIIANDMSEEAVNTIKDNMVHNEVEDLIVTSQEDACVLMYQHRKPPMRFAAIDLDPYGCPSIFLDSAVQSVENGGLLLVTATDMAVLAGNAPETCYSKYGSISVKAKCCHELALRILLQCIECHANRHGRYIVPLLSVSADFYVRVFVKVYSSALHVKKSISKLSMIYHCVGCDNITLLPLGKVKPNPTERNPDSFRTCLPAVPPLRELCENCNQRHHLAGPIWSAAIHDEAFVTRVLLHVQEHPELFGTAKRMTGMLAVVREELHDVPLYYTMTRMFGSVHLETMPMLTMRSAILNAGYRVSYSHASKYSIKTNAPPHFMWDIVRTWEKTHPIKPAKLESDERARHILSQQVRGVVQLCARADANPASRREARLRFQLNPAPHWGPGTRASINVYDGTPQKSMQNQNKHGPRNKSKRRHSPASPGGERKKSDTKTTESSETD